MTNFANIVAAQHLYDLKIVRIKQKLADELLALPDNPKITRLSDRCFTISSADLSSDLCLTPEYYDFKRQYELIVQIISECSVERAQALMEDIIRKGSIHYPSGVYHRFHPNIVEQLKIIME